MKDFLEKLTRDKWKCDRIGFFDRLGLYFIKHFGPDWNEKDKFFQEFEESFMQGRNNKKQEK